MNTLDIYRPLPSWFAHKPYGIHGIAHAARVLVWANRIGAQLMMDRTDLNIEVVRWSAVLHDVGRLSDGWDAGHGARSAAWVVQHRDNLPVALENEVIEQIQYCCQWHEIKDGDIPIMTQELMCLKDADGLDRVRINDLNPDYLRTRPARLLVDQAWSLYRASESANGSWRALLKTARNGGYLDVAEAKRLT